MPSGAKRRKAAKKKNKAAAIPNGNGMVKIVERVGDDEVATAVQHRETKQNPIVKDAEDKENYFQDEFVENGMRKILDGDVVRIVGEEINSKNSILKNSTNDSSKAAKEGANVVKNGHSNVVNYSLHEPEFIAVHKSVGCTVADLNLRKYDEKVHPLETLSDLEAETLLVHDTKCGEVSTEFVAKELPLSSTQIGNADWNVGSADIQHSAEREPLLLSQSIQVNKTSWTGCCGLLELFTGSSI